MNTLEGLITPGQSLMKPVMCAVAESVQSAELHKFLAKYEEPEQDKNVAGRYANANQTAGRMQKQGMPIIMPGRG